MTFINIVEVVASLIVALGGWEAIRYLINRRANRKKENAEADKELVSLQDSRYSEILRAYKEEIEDLKQQLDFAVNHQKTRSEMIEDLQSQMTAQVKEHQLLIEEKNSRIEALMAQVNQLSSQVTALTLLRCKRICPNRLPPSEWAMLNIQDGIPMMDDSKDGIANITQ